MKSLHTVFILIVSLFVMSVKGGVVVVELGSGIRPGSLVIRTGDTLTWVSTVNYPVSVRGLNGEFASPTLTNQGASYSFTFATTGFVAYANSYGVPGTIRIAGPRR